MSARYFAVAGLLAATAIGGMLSVFADCAAATASFLYALCEDKVGGSQLVGERDPSALREPARDVEEARSASAPAMGMLKVAE